MSGSLDKGPHGRILSLLTTYTSSTCGAGLENRPLLFHLLYASCLSGQNISVTAVQVLREISPLLSDAMLKRGADTG
jgi:hypothetical protein